MTHIWPFSKHEKDKNLSFQLLKDRQSALAADRATSGGAENETSPSSADELSDYENASEEDKMVQKIMKVTGIFSPPQITLQFAIAWFLLKTLQNNLVLEFEFQPLL